MVKARIDVEQCKAKSKATGERCRRRVVGGGVCIVHGQNAKTRATQEARALVMRARAYGDVEDRTPAEALVAAAGSLDATVQRLEILAGEQGGADPLLLKEIRSAAEASARAAKLVQDAGLDERRLTLAEREQLDIASILSLVLGAYGLDGDTADVRSAVVQAMGRVQRGDLSPLPTRLVQQITSGDEEA